MAKWWGINKNKSKNAWESRDQWHYRDEQPSYGWLKRAVAAMLIFGLVYLAHVSGTAVGRYVDQAVRYSLSVETDFAYIADQIINHAPKNVDMAVLKRVQNTVSRPADPLLYMVKPVEGKIVSPFGWQMHPVLKKEMMHDGIDIEAALGTSVRAAAPGKVKTVTDNAQNGKMLIIEHSKEIETVYGHLGEVLVKEGEDVSQGQVVAHVGKTGMTNSPMLYFEVRDKGTAIDPLTRIKGDFPVKEGK